MRVFSATLEEFQDKLLTNQLFQELEARFPSVVGHSVVRGEASSWRGSLPRLEAALRLAKLRGDVHVTLEERVPYFSKRIDACLFGHTDDAAPYAVIVELKGWGEARREADDNVTTFLGGAERVEPHPSAQADGYHQHLLDYRRVFALNVLGEMIRRQLKQVYMVSGSAAFTHDLRRILGKRLAGQIRFTALVRRAEMTIEALAYVRT